MNKYYVYAHRKPNGEIFYVGKGSGKRAWTKDQPAQTICYCQDRAPEGCTGQ